MAQRRCSTIGISYLGGQIIESPDSSRICSTRPVQAADDREAESAQI